MKLLKRAQGATEYLIILAVVIIIALIVIGVMGGIPGIGAGGKSRASASYWSTQDVGITQYSVDAGGDVSLTVRNNMRDTITVTAATVGGSADLIGAGADITIPAGATSSIAGAAAIPAGVQCTAGSSYSYGVTLTFTDPTGASITLDGQGNNLEGTCAN